MSNVFDLIGRILISSLFINSAYNKLVSIDGTMSWMEGYGVPGFFLYPAIALEIILPLFVIIGYKPRISAGLLATFCLATAFIFHLDFTDPMQKISFLKNIGLAGGFLFIVANGTKDWSVDREKKYVRL
tara:strand:- start:865 stop:1251 length:387 start_codon:yes stop_codon:yes gene_type:complete